MNPLIEDPDRRNAIRERMLRLPIAMPQANAVQPLGEQWHIIEHRFNGCGRIERVFGKYRSRQEATADLPTAWKHVTSFASQYHGRPINRETIGGLEYQTFLFPEWRDVMGFAFSVERIPTP